MSCCIDAPQNESDADEGAVAARRSGASRLRSPQSRCSSWHSAGRRSRGPLRQGRPGRAHRPPVAEPVFVAVLRGAPRDPWTPHSDPRLEALVAGFQLLLAGAEDGNEQHQEVG